MKNSLKIVSILLIVLGLGLIFGGSYMAFTEEDKKENPNDKEPVPTTIPVVPSEDALIVKSEKLLEDFGLYKDVTCGGNLFDEENISFEDFNKIHALEKVDVSKIQSVPCSSIYTEKNGEYFQGENGVCKVDSSTNVILYNDVNEIYKNMYGSDMPKVGVSVAEEFYKFYDYNPTLDAFVKLECSACGGACGPYVLVNQIKNAELIDNKLVVNLYHFYGNVIPEVVDGVQTFSVDLSSIDVLEPLKLDSVEALQESIKANYLNSLDVYQIVFEETGENYILKEIIKK